jgi:two-component system, chemotaxis family, protein-glutamate methylesterase/glutaminase
VSARLIRTLIVDDSAFARKVVREMLASSPLIDVVAAARDGEEALEITNTSAVDVVVCDLHMPRVNGVEFVRRQMVRRPMPILILSAAAEDAAEMIDALNAGAIDVVRKPSALATDDLRVIRDELVEKVKAAAGAPLSNLVTSTSIAAPPVPQVIIRAPSKAEIVVLGISTGGPQALRRMIPLLPATFPVPLAIVLHMPVGYTALYAEKLNEVCPLNVKEAEEGDLLQAGRVLLAPAGRHLNFRRTVRGDVVAHLSMQPLEKIHRPSVDVLFRSAADVFRDRVLAVVMTGMGDDGKEGAAWVKAQGGYVITEAEKSCVIYGMPRSVVEAGLSDVSIPLDDMAEAISSRI